MSAPNVTVWQWYENTTGSKSTHDIETELNKSVYILVEAANVYYSVGLSGVYSYTVTAGSINSKWHSLQEVFPCNT